MNRRHFMKVAGGAAILSSGSSQLGAVGGSKGTGHSGRAAGM
jgi:hypothetical protein